MGGRKNKTSPSDCPDYLVEKLTFKKSTRSSMGCRQSKDICNCLFSDLRYDRHLIKQLDRASLSSVFIRRRLKVGRLVGCWLKVGRKTCNLTRPVNIAATLLSLILETHQHSTQHDHLINITQKNKNIYNNLERNKQWIGCSSLYAPLITGQVGWGVKP